MAMKNETLGLCFSKSKNMVKLAFSNQVGVNQAVFTLR